MGSLTFPTLSLLCLLMGSFCPMVEGIEVFDTLFGSMTWVRGCGSTTPWSALSPTWGSVTPVSEIEGNTCSGVEDPA